MYVYTDYTYSSFNGPDPEGRGFTVTFRDKTGEPKIQEIFDKRFTLEIQEPIEKNHEDYKWEVIGHLKDHYHNLLETCCVNYKDRDYNLSCENFRDLNETEAKELQKLITSVKDRLEKIYNQQVSFVESSKTNDEINKGVYFLFMFPNYSILEDKDV